MSQEPTTYLKLELRDDVTQYHRNLIMDTILVEHEEDE